MGKYCTNCGTRLKDRARFCASCKRERQQSSVSSEPYDAPINQTYQSSSPPVSAATPPQWKKRSVIAILVAILVIIIGLQFMSLSIVGKTATASVIEVRQDGQSYGESRPDPRRFRINYVFYVAGESYTGNASMMFKQGVRSNQTIKVRYLPFYPSINAPAENSKVLSGLFMVGLGTLFLVMSVRGKIHSEIRIGRGQKQY